VSDIKNRFNFVVLKDEKGLDGTLVKASEPFNKSARSERGWLSEDFATITTIGR